MTVCIFPGQGSQSKGMGGELFDKYPALTQEADNILGYSISELCLNDPLQQLGNTEYTQPALFVVAALAYLEYVASNAKTPNFVAGHSLGEYNALFAAKVIDFATGLKLVQKRGALMAKAQNGGMAAVIGFDVSELKAILTKQNLNTIDIANLNSRTQIVISGQKQDVEVAKKIIEDAGARMVIMLSVSGAFHSRYMQSAADEFAEFLSDLIFAAPATSIISNVEARPASSAEVIKSLLVQQITHPVNWYDSMRYLMDQGETEFVELGAGKVLTRMLATIKRGE
jgi:trans-AT polyketide synthase/acyltransferase/oxidoreductase domain-containing protein